MKPKNYVNLHSHSGFSTFDGLGYPNEHIDFVIENGMNAWALTDHGHMSGYPHAYLHTKNLKSKGVDFKFIPGCEFYVNPDLKQWKKDYELQKQEKSNKKSFDFSATIENEDESKKSKFYDPIKRRHHLVVLAKSSKGLENLFTLVSKGYSDGFYRFPRIDYTLLKEHSEDLIVSSACIAGPWAYDVLEEFQGVEFDQLVPSLLTGQKFNNVINKMQNTADRLVDAVGIENVFCELQFNKLMPQHLVNKALIELSKRTGIRLVATADSHYCRPEFWKDRELYKKLGWLNYTQFDPNLLPQSIDELKCELYPKNADQMWGSYKDYCSEFDFYDDNIVSQAIENSYHIAHDMIGDIEPDTSIKLPSYVVPDNMTAFNSLFELCKVGLQRKGFLDNEKYLSRLKDELSVIKEKDFSKYFLTMKKIIDIANKSQITGPGRGSAAGSLVNYLLDITQVDPMQYDLLFSRFISRHRKELPDIDQDFADRDLLIEDLKVEFGNDNVIPISNYNTFKLKSLIKDISRFYGVPFDKVNIVVKDLDTVVKNNLLGVGDDKNTFILKYDDCLKYSEKFRQFIDDHPYIGEHINVLFKQNKAIGRHAGGVIVSEKIKERMPLITVKGELQTPWTEGMHFKHLEEFGWIKFDLLGLETLRIIGRAVELILMRHHGIENPDFRDIKKWYDENLHPSKLNFHDKSVYDVYSKGKWCGIFQCTSSGAQKLFMNGKPENITDIAALTSVYRPGPLAANVHKMYLKAKRNPGSVEYEHPLLEECLGETYGLIIFQEQIMKIANVIGGFSLDDCDKLRKAITKRALSVKAKALKETEKLKKQFVSGAIERGFSNIQAENLFKKLEFFSGYGFNKSHAVSYAIDSYMCAWLVTYYESEWLCAYMETQAGNPKKRSTAISELKSFGYEIVDVDINYATSKWTILPGKKFMPSFLTVKGVGSSAINEIQLNRPYKDLYDILWDDEGSWKHSKFNKRAFENLIKIEAFDSLNVVGENKPFKNYKHMHHVLIDNINDIKKKKFKKQDLLNLIDSTKGIDDWSKQEKIKMYKEIVGHADISLFMSDIVMKKLDEKNVTSIDHFDNEKRAGIHWFIVDDLKVKLTKNKKTYLLLTVYAESGEKSRMFCWGVKDDKKINIYENSVCIAKIDKSDFGFATRVWEVRMLE